MQNEGLVLTIGRQMVPLHIARVQEGQIGGDDAEIVSRQTPPPSSFQAYLSKQGFGSGDNCLDFPLR